MALTNSGFDGTVNEAAFAYMAAVGMTDGVESSAAWAVTQGTGRQTSVAAQNGYAFAKGVLSKDTAAILTSIGTPTNGQWYLLCRHIDWTTNTVTVIALPHTTTSTTLPTAAPAGLPAMSTTPGTAWDQPLAWVWVRSSDTTMVLFDLRSLSAGTRLASAEATIVSHTAEFGLRQIRTYKWADATARGAQTGMTEGDIGDQADTDARYRYSGSVWVAILEDTGWIQPTLANSWVHTGGLEVMYRRRNGIVYVKGRCSGGTTNTIFTLPAGFRPASDVIFPAQTGSVAGAFTSITLTAASGAVAGVSGAVPYMASVGPFPADA